MLSASAKGSPKFQCQEAMAPVGTEELSIKLTVGLMILVFDGAVKLATGFGYTSVSYTHLTLPTKRIV